VAVRPKTWVCGRFLAGIAGLNTAGDMDVCLLWLLCVVRYRFVRRADRSSRGVLPSVISKPQQWGGVCPLGLSSHAKKKKKKFVSVLNTWAATVTVTCYPNLGGIQTISYFWNYKENTLSPIRTFVSIWAKLMTSSCVWRLEILPVVRNPGRIEHIL
jgi:hypothetical protein